MKDQIALDPHALKRVRGGGERTPGCDAIVNFSDHFSSCAGTGRSKPAESQLGMTASALQHCQLGITATLSTPIKVSIALLQIRVRWHTSGTDISTASYFWLLEDLS